MRTAGLIAALMAVGLWLGLSMGSAIAKEGATGVVKLRMDQMRALKNERDTIQAMLDGKKYLSKRRLLRSLGIIKSHTGEAMLKLFPKGSAVKPSEADPKIWQEWADFQREVKRFATVVTNFNTAAKAHAPPQLLRKDMKNLRAACKRCHKKYQQ